MPFLRFVLWGSPTASPAVVCMQVPKAVVVCSLSRTTACIALTTSAIILRHGMRWRIWWTRASANPLASPISTASRSKKFYRSSYHYLVECRASWVSEAASVIRAEAVRCTVYATHDDPYITHEITHPLHTTQSSSHSTLHTPHAARCTFAMHHTSRIAHHTHHTTHHAPRTTHLILHTVHATVVAVDTWESVDRGDSSLTRSLPRSSINTRLRDSRSRCETTGAMGDRPCGVWNVLRLRTWWGMTIGVDVMGVANSPAGLGNPTPQSTHHTAHAAHQTLCTTYSTHPTPRDTHYRSSTGGFLTH